MMPIMDLTASTDQRTSTRSSILTDEQIDLYVDDPLTIESHEVAREIISILDGEIANIDAQIIVANVEAQARPLPPERQDWLRRAAYAGAMRRNERHHVIQRDKFLTGTKNQGTPPKDKEEKRLKHERLLSESTERRLKRQTEILRLENERMALANAKRELAAKQTFEHHFARIAKGILSEDQFDKITEAANAAKVAV